MRQLSPADRPVGLTPLQQQGYAYIKARIETDGPPSYDEIRDHLGVGSKSNAHRLVGCLIERGYLVRIPNRPRSLALTPQAPGAANAITIPLEPDVVLLARRQDRTVADLVAEAIRDYLGRQS